MDLTGLLDYERTHHTVRETYDHHKAHEETRKVVFFNYFQPLYSNLYTKFKN